jgi:hypothetical protein
VASSIGATSSPTSPSSGVAAARSASAAVRTAPASNETPLGLVRDAVAVELHDHRIADRLGGGDGLVSGCDDALGREGHGVFAQHLFRRGFRQRARGTRSLD